MDERHTFSEPRLIDSNALKWDLDIYRKGVNDPVETILLSDETLPPRLNKRGKIVWRLPTDPGKLVRNFQYLDSNCLMYHNSGFDES